MRRCLRLLFAALALAMPALVPASASAHDIPNELHIQAIIDHSDRDVDVLLRIPLVLLTSLDLPKRGRGYVDLERVPPHLDRAAGSVAGALQLYADGEPVDLQPQGVQLAPPSNRAFADRETAARHIAQPLPPVETNIFWDQGYFDVHYRGRLPAASATLSIQPWVSPSLATRTTLSLSYNTVGSTQTYFVHGATERLYLNPSWWRAAATFSVMGIEHIFAGIDHVLFILAVVLPFRLVDFWTLAKIVTGFTIAHSITLSLAATGVVTFGDWLPPLVETLIAASIVFMCVENVLARILGWQTISARWLTAALFGLIHGFGFSFVLADKLQLSGQHLTTSLAAFNIGVELGQLAILAVALAMMTLVAVNPRLRTAVIVGMSVVVAHEAWHWTLARAEALSYVRWSEIPAEWTFWTVVAIAVVAVLWVAQRRRRKQPRRPLLDAADET